MTGDLLEWAARQEGAWPEPEVPSVQIVIGDARQMAEVADESIHLVITSPPYWQLKDYGVDRQIGFHETYPEYIASLNQVWQECYRVLHPGCRLCINIGDQFARAAIYGRYKVIPIRTEIIRYCESLGLDYMGAIIWQKQTTMKTTGGATVMGSYPYPRNGIVKVDYEFILLFKKLGKPPPVDKEAKEASRLTQEEWNTFFAGHWSFAGERQEQHLAMFPEELPRRLIKMFSFVGETVLDPFLGSGTTARAARESGRPAVGYEIDPECLPLIRAKVGEPLEIVSSGPAEPEAVDPPPADLPSLERQADPRGFPFGSVVSPQDRGKQHEGFYRVKGIVAPNRLQLQTGDTVELLGVEPFPGYEDQAQRFLSKLAFRQRVRLEFDDSRHEDHGVLGAYVFSENKTFLNAKLIREGFARCDGRGSRSPHLRRCEDQAQRGRKGVWAEEGTP